MFVSSGFQFCALLCLLVQHIFKKIWAHITLASWIYTEVKIFQLMLLLCFLNHYHYLLCKYIYIAITVSSSWYIVMSDCRIL